MDISPAHLAARNTAARNPANQASLDLLASATADRSTLALYATAKPTPGDPPGGAALVEIDLTAAAGTLDSELFTLALDVPIEGQVTGADPVTGDIPLWGRLAGPLGAWWADVTVTVEGGGGEIELAQTGTEEGSPVARLFNGAFCRVISAVLQG